MTNFIMLDHEEHQHLKVITERSARFGDNVMHVATFPFEFRDVQAFYPILFHQGSDGGIRPVALFGLQENENLFLDDDGWQAGYIPAMIRREPFLIAIQPPEDPDQGESVRVLALDVDHPRVNTEEGEALFQPLGEYTDFLEQTADLVEAIYGAVMHSKAFVEALQELDLIEAVTFEIPLQDGSVNELLGFHCVAEEKLQELSGEELGDLQAQGFLMPLFMMLASMAHLRTLIGIKNQRLDLDDGLVG